MSTPAATIPRRGARQHAPLAELGAEGAVHGAVEGVAGDRTSIVPNPDEARKEIIRCDDEPPCLLPNCEADEQDGRVFIKTLQAIRAGDELFYDYGLVIDMRYTQKLKAEFPCWCGAPDCRGTLLAPKRRR